VKPDIAITLDIDVTSDLPAYTSKDYAQPVLGKGVVIILHTSEMLPHVKLRQWVQSVADELKIPYQFMLEKVAAPMPDRFTNGTSACRRWIW
jgi:endoglucanase